MENKKETPKAEIVKNAAAKQEIERNITDSVLARFIETKSTGAIDVPNDYSAENALKSAWFTLQNVQDKEKKPALQVCEKNSIANSLYEMVVNGLNPMKKQCYFIVYGNKLTCQISYQGNIALAKRFSGVKSVIAKEIRKGDTFKTEILSDAREILKEHDSAFENADAEIIGAYCVIVDDNDKEHLTKMTMQNIRKAWLKSATKGNGDVHKDFADEMAKRTVINRACKPWINSSNDENIIDEEKPEIKSEMLTIDITEKSQPVQKTLSIDEKPEKPIVENQDKPY